MSDRNPLPRATNSFQRGEKRRSSEIEVCELYEIIRKEKGRRGGGGVGGQVNKPRGKLAYLQLDSKMLQQRLLVSEGGLFGHHNSMSAEKTRFHGMGVWSPATVLRFGGVTHSANGASRLNPSGTVEILSPSLLEQVGMRRSAPTSALLRRCDLVRLE